jgi:putative two-component system response regulator
LIVDDEPANIAVLADLLSDQYRILGANGGRRALSIAMAAPKPDLILLDVMMPETDGYQVLSSLKQADATRDIPVIFVTALSDMADERRGFALGAVDYITKPIRPEIVLARVAVQLELKSARDRLQDQNAWLDAELHRRARENSLIQDITLNALAELAESRDGETGHHIHRTQAHVEILAREAARNDRYAGQLSKAQQSLVVKASALHDIGKVGIPDRILLKPGPLTEKEFEAMKKHTRIGADTIAKAIDKSLLVHETQADYSALAFLQGARDIALHHHERWDGKGYPDGLAGEAIPLSARLMAVADVYDAMTSKRVYKPSLPHEEVVGHIRDNRGSQFDPDIVEAFCDNQEAFLSIHRQFS